MANEAGDINLPGNFRKLIHLFNSEPRYAPPKMNNPNGQEGVREALPLKCRKE